MIRTLFSSKRLSLIIYNNCLKINKNKFNQSFTKPIFSQPKISVFNSHSYTTMTTTTKDEIKSIVESIENQPDNVENYYNLTGLIINNNDMVVFIKGKEYNLKELYLKIIDMDQDQKVYLELYNYLSNYNNKRPFYGEIQLLNGNKLNGIELLFKEIEINPENPITYLELSNFLKDKENDEIEIPIIKFNNKTYYNHKINKINLLRQAFYRDPNYPITIEYFSHFIHKYNINEIEIYPGNKVTRKEICVKNYLLNKHRLPASIINLANCLIDSNFSSGDIEITALSVLLEGIKMYPMISYFHYQLSTIVLKNNNETLEIMDHQLKILKSKNRIDIMIEAIQLDENIQLKYNNVSPHFPIYYHRLGTFLQDKEHSIQFTVCGVNKTWNNISLFKKSLELNPNSIECQESLNNYN